jgi:hypothetical protein
MPDFPSAFGHRPSPAGPQHLRTLDGISRFLCIELACSSGFYDSAGPVPPRAIGPHRVADSTGIQGRQPDGVISELNGRLARSPTDETHQSTLRYFAHGSGSHWIATPYM